MEKIEIDLGYAAAILENAFSSRTNYFLTAFEQEKIKECIGINLTYSYIFITELLAKSSNEKANPICIQAGANLDGAYDARSLCHKVIVKNQRINALLGNSNEPFLNKPARIPSLDKQTAFKSLDIKLKVQNMIAFLKEIDSSNRAFEFLKYALFALEEREKEKDVSSDELIKNITNYTEEVNQRFEAIKFYKNVMRTSCEGESLVLCVLTALTQYYSASKVVTVLAHPSNESGASDREVEDIDLYFNEHVFCCIELKDKDFDVADLSKSVSKVVRQKIGSLLFVIGLNGKFIGNQSKLNDYLLSCQKIGINVTVCSVEDFLSFIVNLTPNFQLNEVLKYGIQSSADIRAKTKTLDNWKKLISSFLKKEI